MYLVPKICRLPCVFKIAIEEPEISDRHIRRFLVPCPFPCPSGYATDPCSLQQTNFSLKYVNCVNRWSHGWADGYDQFIAVSSNFAQQLKLSLFSNLFLLVFWPLCYWLTFTKHVGTLVRHSMTSLKCGFIENPTESGNYITMKDNHHYTLQHPHVCCFWSQWTSSTRWFRHAMLQSGVGLYSRGLFGSA